MHTVNGADGVSPRVMLVGNDFPFLLIDYIPFPTVHTILRWKSPPHYYQWLKVFQEAAISLQEIHRKGIVHCDISSANVLVDINTCEVFIIDFGLAVPVGYSLFGANDPKERRNFPQYSPEQWAGQGVTPACDTYSLGYLMERVDEFLALKDPRPALALFLRRLCASMTREDPALRPSLPEVVAILQNRLSLVSEVESSECRQGGVQ